MVVIPIFGIATMGQVRTVVSGWVMVMGVRMGV